MYEEDNSESSWSDDSDFENNDYSEDDDLSENYEPPNENYIPPFPPFQVDPAFVSNFNNENTQNPQPNPPKTTSTLLNPIDLLSNNLNKVVMANFPKRHSKDARCYITIYQNGILIQQQFIENTDQQYNHIINTIQSGKCECNFIPLNVNDIEIIDKKSQFFTDSNS